MKLFEKVAENFQPLTIFAKSFDKVLKTSLQSNLFDIYLFDIYLFICDFNSNSCHTTFSNFKIVIGAINIGDFLSREIRGISA